MKGVGAVRLLQPGRVKVKQLGVADEEFVPAHNCFGGENAAACQNHALKPQPVSVPQYNRANRARGNTKDTGHTNSHFVAR